MSSLRGGVTPALFYCPRLLRHPFAAQGIVSKAAGRRFLRVQILELLTCDSVVLSIFACLLMFLILQSPEPTNSPFENVN